MCRRASGAPGVPWATFKRDRLEWLAIPPALYQSSAKARRGFCPHCGSVLLFEFVAEADWVDLAVGSFDEPDSLPPAYHIYTSTRVGWADQGPGLPSYVEGKPKH